MQAYPNKINVTQEHIDHGTHGSVHDCPIAKALKDCGLNVFAVGGGLWGGIIQFYGYDGKLYAAQMTPAILRFIIEFDRDHKVEPFVLTLKEMVPPLDYTSTINYHPNTIGLWANWSPACVNEQVEEKPEVEEELVCV